MEQVAKVFYQEDCDLSLLYGKTIAVIGYGSQGHAHALNAKESLGDNARVIIGLYKGSKSWAKAEAQGFEVFTAAEAAKQADIIMILINDEKQAAAIDGPVLIDCAIDCDAFVLPMLPPGGCIDDIIVDPASLYERSTCNGKVHHCHFGFQPRWCSVPCNRHVYTAWI